ncbi:hypothetical protein [Brochothrix thermosphacta]|uniref:hypothetical protein n=1 Tax=Brochothrix thermosphacta TaxID=2756 RepID=UPI0039B0C35F
MITSRIIISSQEKVELYRVRYEIFVVRDKNAPRYLYKNRMLKDKIDDDGIHIGCFEKEMLVGFLTVILKKQENYFLPIERQPNLSVPKKSAEIMRLIIRDNRDIGIRAQVMRLLLIHVKKQS